MKLTFCLSLLVGLVSVYAQEEQAPACKYGKRTVSECDGEEFTFTIEGKDCQIQVKRTGKCVADSDGNMVPVTNVFKRLECFYTLPDMSGICDPETKTLAMSQTLVSGNEDECEETIETTVQCSENDDGELVPNIAGGKGPNSERPDAPPRRGGRRFEGARGGRRNGKGVKRGGREARSAGDDSAKGTGPRARRPLPGNEDGGDAGGEENGPHPGNENGGDAGGKGTGPRARRPIPGNENGGDAGGEENGPHPGNENGGDAGGEENGPHPGNENGGDAGGEGNGPHPGNENGGDAGGEGNGPHPDNENGGDAGGKGSGPRARRPHPGKENGGEGRGDGGNGSTTGPRRRNGGKGGKPGPRRP